MQRCGRQLGMCLPRAGSRTGAVVQGLRYRRAPNKIKTVPTVWEAVVPEVAVEVHPVGVVAGLGVGGVPEAWGTSDACGLAFSMRHTSHQRRTCRQLRWRARGQESARSAPTHSVRSTTCCTKFRQAFAYEDMRRACTAPIPTRIPMCLLPLLAVAPECLQWYARACWPFLPVYPPVRVHGGHDAHHGRPQQRRPPASLRSAHTCSRPRPGAAAPRPRAVIPCPCGCRQLPRAHACRQAQQQLPVGRLVAMHVADPLGNGGGKGEEARLG